MHRRLATMAAAFLLTIAPTACTDRSDGDAETTDVRPAAPAAPTPDPVIPAEPSAQILRETRLLEDPAPLGSVQRALGVAPVLLPPGPHRFDALGTPITLHLTEHWRLDSEHPGKFALTRPDAELESLLPIVLFARPVGLADPRRAGTHSVFPGSSGWRSIDLGTWIDEMDQIVVLGSGTTTVDGVTTRWWDVDVDPSRGPTLPGCLPGTCVAMFWSGATETFTVARDQERLRWYEIDDRHGPIVVLLAATDDDFTALVHDVDALLASAELGPSRPHPVEEGLATASFMNLAANRPWRLVGLPGVLVESETSLDVDQRRGGLRIVTRDDNDLELLRPLTDPDGNAPATAEDVVSALLQHPGATVLDESATMLGLPATVVELTHRSDDPPALLLTEVPEGFDPSEASWPVEPHNRAWVFDAPTGPLIVNATSTTQRGLESATGRAPTLLTGVTLCATDSCEAER